MKIYFPRKTYSVAEDHVFLDTWEKRQHNISYPERMRRHAGCLCDDFAEGSEQITTTQDKHEGCIYYVKSFPIFIEFFTHKSVRPPLYLASKDGGYYCDVELLF